MSKQQASIAYWLRQQAAEAAAKGDKTRASKAGLAVYMVEQGKLEFVVVR
jgi:hypothetical protein